eukprot:422292-Rhodomonas_salina.3
MLHRLYTCFDQLSVEHDVFKVQSRLSQPLFARIPPITQLRLVRKPANSATISSKSGWRC